MKHVTVPIFPLPGLVLFPRTMLPLHIFEPRYAKMIKDALAGDRRLATAQLRKGWDKDYYGAPPVFRSVTIARILHEETLSGNRYNILLEGIERAEVLEEVPFKPYRKVKVAPLVDYMPENDMPSIHESKRVLLALAEELAEHDKTLRGCLTNLDNTHLHPGIIADQVAAALVKAPYERQSLLEQRSVLRRIDLVNVQLRMRLLEYQDSTLE